MANDTPSDVLILDLEFEGYLIRARYLLKEMILADDKTLAAKYIKACIELKNSEQVSLKIHRNRFFRFLLKTMERTVKNQARAYYANLPEGVEIGLGKEMIQWSPDKKSYMAAKIIPGYATLIYMACTNDPELGWDERGFSNFSDINDVPDLIALQQPKEPARNADSADAL